MGTATVARMKVLTTGLVSLSQGPTVRFSTVSVGKTAIQIISASWCLLGGPGGFRVPALGVRPPGEVAGRSGWDMFFSLFVFLWVGVVRTPVVPVGRGLGGGGAPAGQVRRGVRAGSSRGRWGGLRRQG